jgi:hypothetical protein
MLHILSHMQAMICFTGNRMAVKTDYPAAKVQLLRYVIVST